MMTSAFVLILAILVLGGLLATLGDRLGTKVGKARLSLFGLRPRQTATVVTIITGFTIAASTLGILFATSKSLRVGVFKLDEKLKELREAQKELFAVTVQKQQVEAELIKAREQQIVAQQELDAIDKSLQEAIAQQTQTEGELERTQTELEEREGELDRVQGDFERAKRDLNQIESKFERAQTQLQQVTEQAQTLRQDIELLQTERQELIEQGEQVRKLILERDRELAEKRRELANQKQEIQQQKRLLAEQKLQIAAQSEDIARQGQEIAKQKDEMAAQEQELAAQEREIAAQEQQLAAQEQELTTQEQELAAQEEAIAQREAQIERQELEIAAQEEEIAAQTRELAAQDREISQQETAIAQQQKLLKELGNQQAFLQREVQNLERDFQLLREGTVAIRRNQVLASGVVRVLRPYGAREATQELLQEANRAAIDMIRPGTSQSEEEVIFIPNADIEQLVDRIDDGRDYVVRILSAANYLLGETQVDVFADAVVNQVVFQEGEIVATTSVEPAQMSAEEIQERLNLLLGAANFRAKRSGILADSITIGDGHLAEAIEFLIELENYGESMIVQAIAAETTYTVGPLIVELVVIRDGAIVFHSE
ncbi:DUF3084 domain-containing protein [Phormidium sp. CCY1219]|uniref:DUF3084 domain-containing protein n=1 Tax=Phormidium sp. CCY1219 TaxID=2886104 RepID=UPI002D1EC50F|nr:DUF3084 domain-containing protein [Phormidium sp. CCY1219]MEB3830604.1 DUF3084 domain-containing protein [Phormidium sp. CCY1219]